MIFFQTGLNFLRRLALHKKKTLMTARVSMLLKSRASLTCFRACFLPGRAKDLSAPRYFLSWNVRLPVSSRELPAFDCSLWTDVKRDATINRKGNINELEQKPRKGSATQLTEIARPIIMLLLEGMK